MAVQLSTEVAHTLPILILDSSEQGRDVSNRNITRNIHRKGDESTSSVPHGDLNLGARILI
jgi:hypothetical protein